MSTFDETKHHRERTGKFTPKPHAEADSINLEPKLNSLNPTGTIHADYLVPRECSTVQGGGESRGFWRVVGGACPGRVGAW